MNAALTEAVSTGEAPGPGTYGSLPRDSRQVPRGWHLWDPAPRFPPGSAGLAPMGSGPAIPARVRGASVGERVKGGEAVQEAKWMSPLFSTSSRRSSSLVTRPSFSALMAWKRS